MGSQKKWTVGDLKQLKSKFTFLNDRIIADNLNVSSSYVSEWWKFPDDSPIPSKDCTALDSLYILLTQNWYKIRLEQFMNDFDISRSVLATFLNIDPSTIHVWLKKNQLDLIPQRYWKELNRFERECKKASVDSNADSKIKIGPVIAGAIGMGIAGPIGGIIGSGLAAAYQHLSTDERECPYCAETIKKKAILCKHCHSKVEPVN